MCSNSLWTHRFLLFEKLIFIFVFTLIYIYIRFYIDIYIHMYTFFYIPNVFLKNLYIYKYIYTFTHSHCVVFIQFAWSLVAAIIYIVPLHIYLTMNIQVKLAVTLWLQLHLCHYIRSHTDITYIHA